jgi:sulfur transfer protein SufE
MSTFSEKIAEYKENFEFMRSVASSDMEVFAYIIDLGKKLQKDPLTEEKRITSNQVTQCQFKLYVDWEDGKWKAYSDGMISSGYAYILLDIFNSISIDEAKRVKTEDFKDLGIDDLLSLNRTTGFYQMIDIMRRNAEKV